ncbi:MAG: hypothetical protein NZ807_14420, partial [Dehalococcoidia bacterium]|nr:hypothetical protein [Dehalococcoidia bacterium]
AYAVSGRLSGGRIVVSSCDSVVRVRGRPQNASVTRVPVGRRRYVRAETKPLVVVVLTALACTMTPAWGFGL